MSKILFEEKEEDMIEEEKEKDKQFVAHIALPDEGEIKRKVLKKKQEMLNKYMSSELLEELIEVRQLINNMQK